MIGYSGRDVIHGNRRLGYFPEPDASVKARRGRRTPAVEALDGVGCRR